ncbi:hypothetical protein ACN6KF_003020 [Labrys sp. La1]|uniref:hypothetical protein n=1 Tax=Labrys sp. La1 TaxID=3404917 RepID=UPI003EC0330D
MLLTLHNGAPKEGRRHIRIFENIQKRIFLFAVTFKCVYGYPHQLSTTDGDKTMSNQFNFTAADFSAASSIKSEAVRRLVLDRLNEANGLLIRYASDRFLRLEINLSLWADFVHRSPVSTSYGKLTEADLPSIFSAIAIIEPITAAIRGETARAQKAA